MTSGGYESTGKIPKMGNTWGSRTKRNAAADAAGKLLGMLTRRLRARLTPSRPSGYRASPTDGPGKSLLSRRNTRVTERHEIVLHTCSFMCKRPSVVSPIFPCKTEVWATRKNADGMTISCPLTRCRLAGGTILEGREQPHALGIWAFWGYQY